MPPETHIKMKLQPTVVEGEFFRKIDECLEKIGYRLGGTDGRSRTARALVTGQGGVDLAGSERAYQAGADVELRVFYTTNGCGWDIIDVRVTYSADMVTDSVYITGMNMWRIGSAPPKVHELAMRLVALAEDLHGVLGATETDVSEEYMEHRPLLRITSEGTVRHALHPESCEDNHMVLWAGDPESPLLELKLTCWSVYPPRTGWEKKDWVPLEFEDKFKEFHLIYEDEAGS